MHSFIVSLVNLFYEFLFFLLSMATCCQSGKHDDQEHFQFEFNQDSHLLLLNLDHVTNPSALKQ